MILECVGGPNDGDRFNVPPGIRILEVPMPEVLRDGSYGRLRAVGVYERVLHLRFGPLLWWSGEREEPHRDSG